MKTFIQISPDGKKAHYKFQSLEKPKFAPYITLIEVTEWGKQPNEGDLWDGLNFTPPPAYQPDPVKIAEDNLKKVKDSLFDAMVKALDTNDTKDFKKVKLDYDAAKKDLDDKKAKQGIK